MHMKEARAHLNAVYFGKLRLFPLMFRVTYANIFGFSSQSFVSSWKRAAASHESYPDE